MWKNLGKPYHGIRAAQAHCAMIKTTMEEAKKRLPLNKLARRLGVAAEIPDRDGQCVRCFWPNRHPNGDRNPSFNFHAGLTRYRCFACGVQGDGPDLVGQWLGLDAKEAAQRFLQMAGGDDLPLACSRPTLRELLMPRDLWMGGDTEWKAVGALRRLDPMAISLAAAHGVLRFGTVKGFPCWIVTDESRRLAEARRMDGRPFPATDRLGERKAHTLAGSDKSWPVGLLPAHPRPHNLPRIALAEGGPDLLAAFHFCLHLDVYDTLPVALLGRNCHRLHPGALAHFQGRRVRIFPHADADGGGLKAATRWKDELYTAGALRVETFDFRGLYCRSGQTVNDLNDCADLRHEDQCELEELLS